MRTVLVIVAVASLWYGFVLTFPKLADGHGEPARPMMVRANLKLLAGENLDYSQVYAQSLGKRLLFLDFYKHRYPVFQIRSGDSEVRTIDSYHALKGPADPLDSVPFP